MKSVRFDSAGSPSEVLKTTEIEMPQPQHGEVLVRMLAAPVNPSDLMYVRGHYTIPAQCPATPGFEGVGVVEKSGGGLKGLLFRGKRVVVLNKKGGNWAQYAVVPAGQVIPVSQQLSDEQAATFFVNPATAWVMTCEVLKVPRGAWLVQTAAGSALGRMIVRLARERGFRTLNIVRRESVAEELRSLGADHVEVFDDSDSSAANGDQLSERIRSIVGNSGAKYAVDAVGGATGSAVIRSLGQNGRMLAFGTLSGKPLEFSPRTLMTVGSSVEGFWLGNFMSGTNLIFKLKLIKRLTRLIQSGVLSTEISATFPLDQITSAVRSAEDATQAGKTLLRMP
jgi:NADPH:quinone reductase-like Zn-dependent oxidoreductase